LKPIAVELGLDKDFSISIFSKPHIEIGYERYGFRAKIRPVKAHELLYRIRLLFYGEVKLAFARFGWRLQAIPLRVKKPAVVRAGDASLFHAPIGKRCAAVRAPIVEQTDASLLIAEQN
jgi:hypothetical protein